MPAYQVNPSQSPETEWLLTNALGSFAMGTAAGTPRRRYHALLVASTRPPVERMATVQQVVERLEVGEARAGGVETWLTPVRFAGGAEPHWPASLQGMTRDGNEVSWRFEAGGVKVVKSLRLDPERNVARLEYRVVAGERGGTLALHPLVSLRDFHGLVQAPGDSWQWIRAEQSVVVCEHARLRLRIEHEGLRRSGSPSVWRDVLYTIDADRGQDCVEHVTVPAVYELAFRAGETACGVLWFVADDEPRREPARRIVPGIKAAMAGVAAGDAEARLAIERLVESADAFVVRRGGDEGCTVLAGYPWFADWGRDTMISLPGLLLATGRLREARAILLTFAGHVRRGLVPNRFDDYSGEAHYNTVDASLWFVHAVSEYLKADATCPAGDRATLVATCVEIVTAYERGTDYGIGVDADGLVRAGSPETQLTWMDAQRDGVTFTPRHGKAVEINALWHHGLVRLAEMIERPEVREHCTRLATRCKASFQAKFVRAQGGLFDRLEPMEGGGERAADEIRPNQIFAASLEHSPLSTEQRRGVVRVVREHLLTPFGLRTLSPQDSAYRRAYAGALFDRDGAYHNGTVWPWLIGAYVEAVLRCEPKPESEQLRALLRPLVERMGRTCLGHVSEVCQPEEPFAPDGCPAQAWSTAELLRAWRLVCGGDRVRASDRD